MEKAGKTVEFVRRGNPFMLPVTLRTGQNENYRGLCPLEGQRLDVGAEENEPVEGQAGDVHEDLVEETPAGPAPKEMKVETPPTEVEIKQHSSHMPTTRRGVSIAWPVEARSYGTPGRSQRIRHWTR